MSESGNSYKRLLHGTAIIFIGNFAGMALGFGIRALAARYLGSADYGLIALGLTVVNIAVIFSLFGLPQGVAQKIPRADKTGTVFLSAIRLSVPISVLIAVALFFGAPTIAQTFDKPQFEPILKVFAVAFPFISYIRLTIGGLRGESDARGRVLIQNICWQGAILGILILFVLSGFGLAEIAWAWPLGIILTAGFATIYLLFRTELFKRGTGETYVTSSLVSFSAPLMISDGLWTLVQNIDNLFIGYFLPSRLLGVYDVSYRLALVLLTFISAFSFLIVPIFSELDSSGEYQKMDRNYKLITKWVVFLTLPAYLVLISFPDQILGFVFGQEYTAGATVLMVIATGFLIHAAMGLNQASLIAIGETRMVMGGNVLAFITNLLLNLILIPTFGIAGAALASVSAYTVLNFVFGYRLYKMRQIQPIYSSLVIPAITSTIAYVVSYTILTSMIRVTFLKILPFAVVFSLIHLIIIFGVGGFDNEDIELIQSVKDYVGNP